MQYRFLEQMLVIGDCRMDDHLDGVRISFSTFGDRLSIPFEIVESWCSVYDLAVAQQALICRPLSEAHGRLIHAARSEQTFLTVLLLRAAKRATLRRKSCRVKYSGHRV
jgi:hypothetical protein